MATLVQQTYTVQLPGLVDCVCKFMTERMGPMGALHEHGSEIQPSDGETSLPSFKHVWTYDWHFWDPWLAQTVSTEGLTCLWLPTHPFPPTHPYNAPSVLLQWF